MADNGLGTKGLAKALPSVPLTVKGGLLAQMWRSPWTRWIGLRYLKSKKNSQFLSFITFISIFGVMLGVTSMIVVLSVMEGFETELKKRLMSFELHVLISPKPTLETFQNGYVKETVFPDSVAKKIESDPRVKSFWSVVSTEAIIRTGRKKVAGAMVKGVPDGRIREIERQLIEVAQPQLLYERRGARNIRLPGLYIGRELALELDALPGDRLTLISPTETTGPLSSVPRLKRFVVEGVYQSGSPEQELQNVFAREDSVRSFLRKTGVVTSWEISLKDSDIAPQFTKDLKSSLGEGFRIQDWIELNARLFASLRLERIAMFIILAFIIIVASFNIVTTLTLMVLEKKKEISILKAMGATHSQVGAIFLSEGIFIGAIGVGGGVALGLLLCALLDRYQFIELPDIYYDQTLPVSFSGPAYALIAFSALVIVILACLYPSRRAAKLDPLDGIRYG